MDTTVKRFADRLKYLRKASGMSQDKLANGAKLHPAYISALERSKKIPSLLTLEQLAKGLGVELKTLMDFSEAPTKISDRLADEIQVVVRCMTKCDLKEAQRIRKVVQDLTSP